MSLPPVDWLPEVDTASDWPTSVPVAWEDGEKFSLPALLTTLRAILFHPRRFFASLPRRGDLSEALGFVLLVGSTGILGLFLWQAVLAGNILGPAPAGMLGTFLAALQDDRRLVLGLVLLTPLYVALAQFLFSGFLLVAVRLTGSTGTSFTAVFRVVAYAQAAAVLCLVPWVGGVAARLWHLALIIFGLTQALRLSMGKAILTLVLTILLLAFCFFLLLLLLGFLGLWRFLWG